MAATADRETFLRVAEAMLNLSPIAKDADIVLRA
jgi:hypothetical protein